jgi:hypothetical protein
MCEICLFFYEISFSFKKENNNNNNNNNNNKIIYEELKA